jgi:1-deoxy-D-xylulose-5-phosphate synthase
MAKNIEHIELSSIKSPDVVKKMGYGSLNLLCQDIRTEIIQKTAEYGGHLSSNLGVVELTVAIHRNFNFPKDKLIFDVGHQCYTHKILTGRSLEHLNEKGGVTGFQNIKESEYDCYSAGHSSTSLSAAAGFAVARELKKEDYDIVAVISDSSIVNGLSMEALNEIPSLPGKIIIVLNDNDMSISPAVGGLSKFFRRISTGRAYNKAKASFRRKMMRSGVGKKLYAFTYAIKSSVKHMLIRNTLFDDMGYTYIGPVNGHDLKALDRAFARAKNTSKSVVLHVNTIKGRGYPYAERDTSGYWHGATPFEIESGKPKNLHPGFISWSHFFSDLTSEVMGQYQDAELIVPATLKGSGLEKPFHDFPERCLDVGIAEEHALTMAGALALNGIHPIVAIYSTFLQRAYDEVSHDCARFKANMTLLVDRSGLVGKNGETHQGIFDVAYLKTIPNVVITMPSDKSEAKALFHQSMGEHGVFAIRFPRDFVEVGDVTYVEMPFGRWRFLKESEKKKLALFSIGPLTHTLSALLDKKGLEYTLINPIYLNLFDENDLNRVLDYENIVIYDPYSTKEGFSESLLSRLMEKGFKGKVHVRATRSDFIPAMSNKEQLQYSDCYPEDVASFLESLLK